ncbi:hypothetical protein HG536_0H02750 [Torulaspora globosa]|uniref:Enhancer of translation termination 1 n=1 Tax=Torulaspora globosa TaxID=48254 RepID=A0A7G3ZN14_9SACH|nr:uncharacterized protein HG536_0H02750 [Torulaspora globosa]QLL34900.1 hypothetical protein HG536_0H02750 [Torulaspora globosa]
MAKRALGVGQKNKEKKRRLETETAKDSKDVTPGADQISVELDDNEDLDNEFSQLKGLWQTYFNSDRESDYVVNGVVHECDRLLRQSQEDAEIKKNLNDEFHAIYALALSELTVFKAGEDEDDKKNRKVVSEFFENALERCELGLSVFKDSQLLKLVLAKIVIQRIPLEYISRLKVNSKPGALGVDISEQLEKAKENFNVNKDYLELSFEVLQMFDDLLDIVENFGHENDIDEGLDSDQDEELERVELSPKHPLYKLQQNLSENYQWLRDEMIRLLGATDDKKFEKLYRNIARSAGHLLLKAAEEPTSVFMHLQYGEGEQASKDGEKCKTAQQEALKNTKDALKYLEKAQVEDEPETWVEVAEAYIDLGNLYDYQSKDQENSYRIAEDILKKANKASHGKFQDILDNLLDKD